MIVRTARRAGRSESVSRVVVATDDDRIRGACDDHGIDSILTSGRHNTGTDRVVEASRILGESNVVNIQGDEPLVDPGAIDRLVNRLVEDSSADVANCGCRMDIIDEGDPNVVCVVVDQTGHVMMLSRADLPFGWGRPISRIRHLGLYAFRDRALEQFASRSQGPIECAERIEMFRYLEYGDVVAFVEVDSVGPAVDVPEDVDRLEQHVAANGGWAKF